MTEEQALKDQEVTQIVEMQQRATKSPNHVSLYVNHSQFAFTPFDIQVIFGKVQGGIGVDSSIEELAIITMSPQHAQAFILAFKASLENYIKDQQALVEQQKIAQAKIVVDNQDLLSAV